MRRYATARNVIGFGLLVLGLLVFWSVDRPGNRRLITLPTEPQKVQEVTQVTFKLYFAKGDSGEFAVETRNLEVNQGQDVILRALEELAKGPQSPGASRIVPEGTPPPLVYVRGSTAYLDLPAPYAKLQLGTAGEIMLVYGMTNTVLQFPEISQVVFLLQGRELETLGHLLITGPIGRD